MKRAKLLILSKMLRPMCRLMSQDGDKIYVCSLPWGAPPNKYYNDNNSL